MPEPLYIRLDHADNYHKQWFDWPAERKRGSWTTLFTGWLEAVMPVCTTVEERVFFQQFILDRIAVLRHDQSYHYAASTPQESGVVMIECIERLKKEGNSHLFGDLCLGVREENERLAKLNQDLVAEKEALSTELDILKRSRALKLAREARRMLGISWR